MDEAACGVGKSIHWNCRADIHRGSNRAANHLAKNHPSRVAELVSRSRPCNDAARSIAGAGIGGLGAALALAQIGWKITVLEQSNSFGEVGAGVQISPNAYKVL